MSKIELAERLSWQRESDAESPARRNPSKGPVHVRRHTVLDGIGRAR
jgi:hypothetical protein